jgi:capsule biosynthesis phosphatase
MSGKRAWRCLRSALIATGHTLCATSVESWPESYRKLTSLKERDHISASCASSKRDGAAGRGSERGNMNLPTFNVIGILATMVALLVLICLLSRRCSRTKSMLDRAKEEWSECREGYLGLLSTTQRWRRLFGCGPGAIEASSHNHDDNSMTVAVDLDGVILEYVDPWNGVNHFGDIIPGAVESLEKIKKLGYRIVIYTTRNNITAQCNLGWDASTLTGMVREQLEEHGVPYDQIALFKPLARYYIDDRAIRFEDWKTALNDLNLYEQDRLEDRADEIEEALISFPDEEDQ